MVSQTNPVQSKPITSHNTEDLEKAKPDAKTQKAVKKVVSSASSSNPPKWDKDKKVARERPADPKHPPAGGDCLKSEPSVRTMYRQATDRTLKRHKGKIIRNPAILVHERRPVKSLAVGKAVSPDSKPEARNKIEMFAQILICKKKDQLLSQLQKNKNNDTSPIIASHKEFLTSRLMDSKSAMELRLLDRELRQMISWPKTPREAFKAAQEEYMDQFLILSTYPDNYRKMDQNELIQEIKTIENFYEQMGEKFPEYFDALQNENYNGIPIPVLNQYNAFLKVHEKDPRLASIISPIKSNPQFIFNLDDEEALAAGSDDEKDVILEYNSEDEEEEVNSLIRSSIEASNEEDLRADTPHPLSSPPNEDDEAGSDVGMELLCYLYLKEGFESGTLSGLEKSKDQLQQLLRDNPGNQIIKDAVFKFSTLIKNHGKPEFNEESELILKKCEELKAALQKEHPNIEMPSQTRDLIDFLDGD